MNHNLKVAIYPNREIRATLYRTPSRGADRRDCPAGRDENHGIRPIESESGGGSKAGSYLDISPKLSVNFRPGFGGIPRKTRFGLNAKRIISRAAGVFDHDKIPKEQCLFLTGTIPGGTRRVFESIARWSSWLVKSIKTWISDIGIVSNYSIYCWEFQERGALHIHYLLLVESEKLRSLVLEGWTKKWVQLLDSVGNKEGIDMWERAKGGTWKDDKSVIQAPAQVVQKSVGAYLSDYLSKNAPSPQATCSLGYMPMGPVRWWGCSRPLLARLRELTDEVLIENIPFSGYRRMWERVVERFRGASDGYYEYSDKLKFAVVCVAYGEDTDHVYHQIWRMLRCKLNLKTVAKCSIECRPLPDIPVTRISGRIWMSKLSVSMPLFAVRTRAKSCFRLSFGWARMLSKKLLRNTGPKKIKRKMTPQISIWTTSLSV